METVDTFSPAVNRAFCFVKNNLDKNVWRHGAFLPSTVRLSIMAGVSRASMARALAELKEKKLVYGAERHRARAGSGECDSNQSELKRYPWEKKRKLLEKDIATGAFGIQGRLPVIKELQVRYGVCFRTMRKLLDVLEADGIIQPLGKGYVLPETRSRPQHHTICFITCKGHLGQASALNSGHHRIDNLFENECLGTGTRLEIIEIDFYNSAESRNQIMALSKNDPVMGYLFDVWWYPGENYQRACLDVLDRIAGFQKPIAILDEIGNFDLPLQHTVHPGMQVFKIEGKRAGERVARLLLGLGHQSTAYFSVWPNAGWSQERFEGIQGQFARAGFAPNLHVYADEIDDPILLMFALSGLAESDISKLIKIIRPHDQAIDLQERWRRFSEDRSQDTFRKSPADKVLRKNLSKLGALIRQGWDHEFLAANCIHVLDTAGKLVMQQHVDRMFERALTEPTISSWICASDSIAFGALVFLSQRSIRVPQDISVISFDNVPVDALEKKLTTFDFNAMGFVRRLINFVLRPPHPRGPFRHIPIEIEGLIIERESTGRAAIHD